MCFLKFNLYWRRLFHPVFYGNTKTTRKSLPLLTAMKLKGPVSKPGKSLLDTVLMQLQQCSLLDTVLVQL